MEPDMMDTETPDYFSFLGKQAPKKKRKRGGLAGIWDRNKNIIKPLATGAAGLIPGVGPAVAAGLGAAMGGLDRPGKGGIGLDVGGAVRGGISGYGMGKIGRAAGSKLGSLFGKNQTASAMAPSSTLARGADRAMGVPAGDVTLPNAPRPLPGMGRGAESAALGRGTERAMSLSSGSVGLPAGMGDGLESRMQAAQAASAPSQVPMGGRFSQMAGQIGEAGQRGLIRALQFVEKNPQATGLSLQALSGIMGAQQQRRIEEERQREERRRAENFARAAMPLYLEGLRGMR